MAGRRRDSKQRANSSSPQLPNCTLAGEPCVVIGQSQNPPLCHQDLSCICTNLMFILTGACDACDLSDSSLRWQNYTQTNKCDPTPSNPPPYLLQNTAIPSWVFTMASATPAVRMHCNYMFSMPLNETQPDAFNFEDAENLWNNNVTSSSSSSSTSATPTNSVSTQLTSASPSATSTPMPPAPITAVSKTPSKAGPIAGGIIGAAIFLALVGIGIWYTVIRRRRNHIAPSAAYKAAVRAGDTSPMPYQPVRHEDSPKNSTDDLRADWPRSSWLPSAAVSIKSESRFLEHT
ncbi:hypothetical protein C8R44DRAFT_819980 [Mycena epipterygia]|nr:hypothetical protein C8R44DRAFT_819980 [Mycena epipterygia]